MVLAELQKAVITRQLCYRYRANTHRSELMDKTLGMGRFMWVYPRHTCHKGGIGVSPGSKLPEFC